MSRIYCPSEAIIIKARQFGSLFYASSDDITDRYSLFSNLKLVYFFILLRQRKFSPQNSLLFLYEQSLVRSYIGTNCSIHDSTTLIRDRVIVVYFCVLEARPGCDLHSNVQIRTVIHCQKVRNQIFYPTGLSEKLFRYIFISKQFFVWFKIKGQKYFRVFRFHELEFAVIDNPEINIFSILGGRKLPKIVTPEMD